MTPERKKEFDTYVEALRAVFEVNDDKRPLRFAMCRSGEEKACAFAIVVVPDDIGESGRMTMLSAIANELLPRFTAANLTKPLPVRP